MIKSFFKIFGFIVLIYSVFSLPVGRSNLFGFLTENFNPIIKKAYEALIDNSVTSLEKTQKLGSRLFSNSTPPQNSVISNEKSSSPSEDITEEERNELNNLIKNQK